MGDRTVIEKFHKKKKNEKYLFREKLIVLFWDFFFNVFLFFFLFYYAILAILLFVMYLNWSLSHAQHEIVIERNYLYNEQEIDENGIYFTKETGSLWNMSTVLQKQVWTPPLGGHKLWQRIRKSGQKMKRPISFRFDLVMIFFLSISLSSSNVDKLWTFFVCLKTERDHMFHMFRPGLAAKSLVIDAFVTIHLDL